MFPENRFAGGLLAFAVLVEDGKHIGIKAQGYLLLRSRIEYRLRKKIRPKRRHVGFIKTLILERINSLPVRPGVPFRIVRLHDGRSSHSESMSVTPNVVTYREQANSSVRSRLALPV
jgi:hypothetical protein